MQSPHKFLSRFQRYGAPFFALLLLLSACAPQRSLTAELVPRRLAAQNLEETISRRDEVMLAYSLTSYDARNQPVAVVNGAWGVVPMKRGQTAALDSVEPGRATPIQLAIPKDGRVVASLVLVEVDDYAQAQQTLARIRQVHNVVAAPAALLLTGAEVLTPLKYVSAGLVAAGVGFQLVDRLDKDDVLGQSSTELRDAELRRSRQRQVRVPAQFSGRNLRDAFAYELTYDILLKSLKINRQP